MDAQAASFATAVPRRIASEFRLEWIGIAAIMVVDVFWAARIGFSLRIVARDVIPLLGALASTVFFRIGYRDRRCSLATEYIALSAVSTAAFCILSYLCAAASFPLIDAQLQHMDNAIGFDWQYWFGLVRGRDGLLFALRLVYDSIVFQALFFVIFYGLQQDRHRMREVYWIMFVASGITAAVSAFLPAVGNLGGLKDGDMSGYLAGVADLNRLRAGSGLHFALDHLTGLITFPSFHTATAIIYIYAFRRAGAVGVAIACLNVLMLPSIPLIGRHYLVDMFAGAAVAGLSIAMVRHWLRVETNFQGISSVMVSER